ncbi:hypothetical protein EVB94_178 [Rhizobium phage RHph_TM40]|uniref:Uncharacterized protein n=1 Tax=Rhizobium phage RHph_TM30 TaxID=2509764 RepID=A0A7S5UWC5_9CAUD|nr:hypothetical protein PQC16_gp179 [Rhizobium phage RHph_TM30]QIG71286.1 hypothetical protein EVB93_179 [Rhizobium phage RHph_TM30]QIG71649.1 hypothetical protein EVB94_178 [Rhizobium phage RHph_TM40]QIG72012.1 hypothetical protein EVB95_178 [Rhizobium phage RHph_TM2_3B]QIG72375.1 hypothetical protein EVB96_179 [Rhizobium phage RHph_TM3_3_6]
MSIVVVNGQNFDIDTLDFSEKSKRDDWHSNEGKFIRLLKQDVYLTSKILEYVVDNVDDLIVGYKSSDGLSPSYFRKSLLVEINEIQRNGKILTDNFMNSLFIRYNSIFVKVIKDLSSAVSIDEKDEDWVWTYDSDGKIVFDYSHEALSRRRTHLQNFDRSILPLDYTKLEDVFTKPEFTALSNKRVVCWSCGSYKTTLIRQFIVKHWLDGILYACSTIEEVNLLTYDIACFIGEENVFKLHHQIDTDIYAEYHKNPEFLKEKSVVVTTHSRLMKDPPSILITQIDDPLGGDSRRQYVLIDEKPQFYDHISLNNDQVQNVMNLSTDLSPREAQKKFREGVKNASGIFKSLKHNSVELLSKSSVDRSVNFLDTRVNPTTGAEYFVPNINMLRAEFAVSMIVKQINKKIKIDPNYEIKKDKNRYFYNLGDLEFKNLIIFDGTGDLILNESPDWKIIKTPETSFNFKGSFNEIESDIRRRLVGNDLEHSSQEFDKIIQYLIGLTEKHEKIFVVSWKDMKGNEDDMPKTGAIIDNNVLAKLTDQRIVQATDDLNAYIKFRIPLELRHKFEFTYYLSGKTRGTNRYVDCDAVVLLGSFYIPNHAIAMMNEQNNAKMTNDMHSMAEIVQAIYRTRARKLKPVDVYYTSDWSKQLIVDTMKYINAPISDEFTSDIQTKMRLFSMQYGVNITPTTTKLIKLLASKYSDLIAGDTSEYQVPPDEDSREFKRGIQNLLNKVDELRYEDKKYSRFFKVIPV